MAILLGNVAIIGLGTLFVLVVAASASASSSRHIDAREPALPDAGNQSNA